MNTDHFKPLMTRFTTVAEAAEVMRVSKMTIHRLIEAGEIPAHRFGRNVRIPTAALWSYIRGAKIDPNDLSKAPMVLGRESRVA